MSKVSVAFVCGGIVTITPSAGSRPARTKQKDALVLSPVPSCSGHLTSAGSIFGTCFATGAGFRVLDFPDCDRCAVRVAAAAKTHTKTTTGMRRQRIRKYTFAIGIRGSGLGVRRTFQ